MDDDLGLPPVDTSNSAQHLLVSCGTIPRLIAGAFTGMLALAGAFTGAMTGALAGTATDCGFLRGAGLGAVAGAVLSIEVLEASCACWQSESSCSRILSILAEIARDMLNGRFLQEQVTPNILNPHRWQANVSDMQYEDLYELFGPGEGSEGASKTFLENLPSHYITDENRMDPFGDIICCTICLQDLLQGEKARCLPSCNHIFHMSCVDKWLAKQGSCPVCRRYVQDNLPDCNAL